MHVFLSHSSLQKPLVREIKAHLPHFLSPWIDEEKLLFGDDITTTIEATIKTDTDYVLLFVDDSAVRSSWVRREMQWALEAEKQHNRIILLPIMLGAPLLDGFCNLEVRNRKYLHLQDFQESSVRSFARSVSDALFALICRDMHHLHHPVGKTALAAIAEADRLLQQQAAIIRKIVFPHRSTNPIPREKLLEIVNAHCEAKITRDDFEALLTSILHRNLVPGLNYDGYAMFLVEEHAMWKGEVNREKKELIARKAAGYVRNGMRILLDAGSTVEEVVLILCKKIETRAITKLAIVTTSVNSADIVSDCCVRMGFDDDFCAVSLMIPGGRVRPSTQAIVPTNDTGQRDLESLAKSGGRFDLGIVGVNGIDARDGLTTHDNAERVNKKDILELSDRSLVLGDSSKVGLVLGHRFAGFDDNLTLIINDDPENEALKLLVERHADKIVLA